MPKRSATTLCWWIVSRFSWRAETNETIHQHNVVAERFGLLGELRNELSSGEHLAHHTSMREWLDASAR